MGRIDDRPQIGPRAERVGGLRHGDGPRPPVDERRQQLRAERPGIVERKHAQLGARAFAEHLPRHDVRVVLQLADYDVVARLHEAAAPSVSHGIERRRSTRRKDDLLGLRGTDERRDARPRLLVTLGHLLREAVHPAVDVGVVQAVQLVDRVDHAPRLLGRGAAVEVDERLAVDRTREQRKLLPYLFDIQHDTIF